MYPSIYAHSLVCVCIYPPAILIYIIKCAYLGIPTKYIFMHKTCIHTLSLIHAISSPYTSVTIYTNISPIICGPIGLPTDKIYSNVHTQKYT